MPSPARRLVFLTNNFTLPALTIAQIYKQRWQVELFFRWIKMHLRIKAFYGTSENAVMTQIWIAVSVYVLVAIVRNRLGIEDGLYQILQILSLTLFEKTPVLQALQEMACDNDLGDTCNQLNLFDLWPDSSVLNIAVKLLRRRGSKLCATEGGGSGPCASWLRLRRDESGRASASDADERRAAHAGRNHLSGAGAADDTSD